MIHEDGQQMLDALAAVEGLDHTGWASEAMAAEDITVLSPGGWIQPGAAEQSSEAGNGRHARTRRTWVFVLTLSAQDETPLEQIAGPLLEQCRNALTGLQIGEQRPKRRLRYIADGEPYYEPGWVELPLEFELSETFTGDTQ